MFLNLYILEYWRDNLIYIIKDKCLWILDILHDWIPENRSWKSSWKKHVAYANVIQFEILE